MKTRTEMRTRPRMLQHYRGAHTEMDWHQFCLSIGQQVNESDWVNIKYFEMFFQIEIVTKYHFFQSPSIFGCLVCKDYKNRTRRTLRWHYRTMKHTDEQWKEWCNVNGMTFNSLQKQEVV